MAESIELVPAVRHVGSGAYVQPAWTALDVGDAKSVSVELVVLGASLSADVDFFLETSMFKDDNAFWELGRLRRVASASPPPFPDTTILQTREAGAPTRRPHPVDGDCIGCWRFNESGDTANAVDSSGNGLTLTNVNGCQEKSGIIGRAHECTGSAYYDRADEALLRPASITMATWVKIITKTGNQSFFATKYRNWPPMNFRSYGIELHNYLSLHWCLIAGYGFSDEAGHWSCPASDTSPNIPQDDLLNKWHHAAATYDSSTGVACVYWDGELVSTRTKTGSLSLLYSTHPFRVGTGSGVWLEDDLALYDVAKDASWIRRIASPAWTPARYLRVKTSSLAAGDWIAFKVMALARGIRGRPAAIEVGGLAPEPIVPRSNKIVVLEAGPGGQLQRTIRLEAPGPLDRARSLLPRLEAPGIIPVRKLEAPARRPEEAVVRESVAAAEDLPLQLSRVAAAEQRLLAAPGAARPAALDDTLDSVEQAMFAAEALARRQPTAPVLVSGSHSIAVLERSFQGCCPYGATYSFLEQKLRSYSAMQRELETGVRAVGLLEPGGPVRVEPPTRLREIPVRPMPKLLMHINADDSCNPKSCDPPSAICCSVVPNLVTNQGIWGNCCMYSWYCDRGGGPVAMGKDSVKLDPWTPCCKESVFGEPRGDVVGMWGQGQLTVAENPIPEKVACGECKGQIEFRPDKHGNLPPEAQVDPCEAYRLERLFKMLPQIFIPRFKVRETVWSLWSPQLRLDADPKAGVGARIRQAALHYGNAIVAAARKRIATHGDGTKRDVYALGSKWTSPNPDLKCNQYPPVDVNPCGGGMVNAPKCYQFVGDVLYIARVWFGAPVEYPLKMPEQDLLPIKKLPTNYVPVKELPFYTGHFQIVRDLTQVRPGDLYAWVYPPGTGMNHILIITEVWRDSAGNVISIREAQAHPDGAKEDPYSSRKVKGLYWDSRRGCWRLPRDQGTEIKRYIFRALKVV